MTAPKPEHFERALAVSLANITRRLADLPALYRTAYNAGLSEAKRDSAGKITRGGVSVPVENVVGDPLDPQRPGAQASIRRALERASRHLADAENAIGAIEKEIYGALDRLDPREGFEPLRYPVSVSQAELEESKAAQQRRVNRGEGVA